MKKLHLTQTAILLLIATGYSSAQNGWEQMEDMLQATSWYGSCIDSINEKVYILGGGGPSETTDLLDNTQIYDLKTMTWSQGANMPDPASGISVEMIDGKIYTLGEYLGTPTLSNVKEYDPVADTWKTLNQLPDIFYSTGSCVYNDSIYVFGGWDENYISFSSAWVYDPVSDNWQALPDMPHARLKPAVCVFNNEIYLFGDNPAMKYDPSNKTWTEIYGAPDDVWGAAIPIVHNDSIFLFGGFKHGNYPPSSNTIYGFDPKTNTFIPYEDMPFARSAEGYKVGNFVYLFGGHYAASLGSVTDEVWKFNLDSLKVKILVTSVVLSEHSIEELEIGETETLVAEVLPVNAYDPSISWSSADSDIATVGNGIVMGLTKGETYIFASAMDGSGVKDSCLVAVGVGIAIDKADRLSIFPNPTNDVVTIQSNYNQHYSIEIISLSGQLIYGTEMEGTSKQIDLTPFSKGIYFITLRSKEFVRTEKVVKY